MNSVNLIGRITKDIDLSFSQKGTAISKFTLAIDRKFKNAQGEKEVDFINCTAFSKTAEYAANYLGKGKLIAVQGELRVDKYQGQDGKTKYSTYILADEVQNLSFDKQDKPQGNKPDSGFVPVEDDEDSPF